MAPEPRQAKFGAHFCVRRSAHTSKFGALCIVHTACLSEEHDLK